MVTIITLTIITILNIVIIIIMVTLITHYHHSQYRLCLFFFFLLLCLTIIVITIIILLIKHTAQHGYQDLFSLITNIKICGYGYAKILEITEFVIKITIKCTKATPFAIHHHICMCMNVLE